MGKPISEENMSTEIEYTRIVKICNMCFEEVAPNQTFTLTRMFTLEEAAQLGCKGYLNAPLRQVKWRKG